jgi:membrane protein required for colicin V production
VDIVGFITSQNLFDIVFIIVLAGSFVLGFIQGTIRRLLGTASVLFSFLVAANLRAPVGSFLASNWTQFPAEYSYMLGFLGMFVVGVVAFSLLIQGFYKKTPLLQSSTIVDEVLGGVLGIVEALLIVGCLIIILDSYFRLPGTKPPDPDELPFLRSFFEAYDSSAAAGLFRDTLIPLFFTVFGFFIPKEIQALFPQNAA